MSYTFSDSSINIAEIAKSLNKALHFNTYGGNPVACAVGSSVIDVSPFSVITYSLKSICGMAVGY